MFGKFRGWFTIALLIKISSVPRAVASAIGRFPTSGIWPWVASMNAEKTTKMPLLQRMDKGNPSQLHYENGWKFGKSRREKTVSISLIWGATVLHPTKSLRRWAVDSWPPTAASPWSKAQWRDGSKWMLSLRWRSSSAPWKLKENRREVTANDPESSKWGA